MCFGMQPTEEKTTNGTANNTGSTTGNSATNATGTASNLGSSQSNTVGSNASATNGLSTTTGVNNQATTGQTVGNTANNTLGTTTSVANPAIESAALGNLNFVKDLQAKGFQGYGGQQVAGFSPDQQKSFGLTDAIVGNGTGDAAKSLIGQYAGAGPQRVNPNTIQSAMSPYMNQYVMDALKPQLAQMDIAQAKTAQATNANATGSGAFGDARTGIEQATNANNANLQREGLIGNAYNSAFNTAIGAGAQDVGNNLTAQNANAGYAETALGRALGGSNALQSLQNQQLGVAGAQNTAGQQQTAQQQAQLTAQYNQWLMAQQYPFQTAALANSTVGQATNALPVSTVNTGTQVGQNVQNTLGNVIGTTGSTTANNQNTVGTNTSGTTGQTSNTANTANTSNTAASGTSQNQGTTTGFSETQKPDNSGLGILGSLGGAVLGNSGLGSAAGLAMFSDIRLKEDIDHVGELHDGTPVFSYRYKADPQGRKQIGLMAQDVKNRRPDAVITLDDPAGTMMVDYGKATERSRAIASMAI